MFIFNYNFVYYSVIYLFKGDNPICNLNNYDVFMICNFPKLE